MAVSATDIVFGSEKERVFQAWYKRWAEKLGLNPDPDTQKYDYRAAYLADAKPDKDGHWPSEFKDDDHPNRFVDGVDTKTGGPQDDFSDIDLSDIMVEIGSPESIDKTDLDLSSLMQQTPGMATGDSTLAPSTDTTSGLPLSQPKPLSLAGTIPRDNVYASSDQFRSILDKALKETEMGGDDITDAQRKQVKMAREQFPKVDAVFQEAERRAGEQEESPSSIHPDLEPVAKSFRRVGEALLSGAAATARFNPEFGAALLDAGKKVRDLTGEAFGEFYGGVLGVEKATGKNLSEHLHDLFVEDIGIGPLAEGEGTTLGVPEPKSGRFGYTYGKDGQAVKRPLSEGERVAVNLVTGALKFAPEMLVAALENPGEFQAALVEFPFMEANLILQAAAGQSVEIEDGKVAHRYVSDEEIDEAKEELKQNPIGPVMLAFMAAGLGAKGVADVVMKKGKARELAKSAAELEAIKEKPDAVQKPKAEKIPEKGKAEGVQEVGKAPKAEEVTLSESIKSRLDQIEKEAQDRLSKRLTDQEGKLFDIGGAAGEGAGMLKDLAIIGATKVARGAVDFTVWSTEMTKQFGDKIKPKLKEIWDESQKVVKGWAEEAKVPEGMVAPREPSIPESFPAGRLNSDIAHHKEAIERNKAFIEEEGATRTKEDIAQLRDYQKQLEIELADLEAKLEPMDVRKVVETETTNMVEKTKAAPEIEIGVAKAKDAMIEHDRQIRRAESTSQLFEKTVKDVVPDKDRQMLMVHAYEHKMKGPWWDMLTESEKETVRWAAVEKEKLNQFIKDNDILDMMESKELNHITHHWINPETGRPYPAMYGKLSKGLPQAKQRTIPDYATGMEQGLTPATTNLGKLIGLQWESAMRAHQSRQMFRTLHNLGAESDLTIKRFQSDEGSPIRMIESWKQLKDQNLTDGYERYSHPSLDKKLAFKDAKGNTVLFEGAVGVRTELKPFLEAYMESPNYTILDQFNFATKSLKLGLSLFHVQSLAMQEMANWRIPYKNIPRGHRLIKELGPDMRMLHQEGLDLFKGYEDIGYQNSFFEGTGTAAKVGNKLAWPIDKMRDFIFGVVQPGMKASFAYDTYQKILPKYQEKYASTKTPKEIEQFAARDAVNAADGHFSHEHYKRALLETNQFMARMYFGPEARKWWQRGLLSPTWQREHLLVAKNVAKSFMPDSWIEKAGLAELGPIKSEYRKYALGAITMVGAVDMWNLMTTQMMDGKSKHIWENPEGKGFAVRAPWNEPGYTVTREDGTTRDIKGGAAYVRPLKSIYEVAEWGKDPVKKFTYKLSPMITAIARQFWPSRYQQEYGGIEDIPKRTTDFALDVGTPISAGQVAEMAKGRRSPQATALPFIGYPTSVVRDNKTDVRAEAERLLGEGETAAAIKLQKEWNDKYPDDMIKTLIPPKAREAKKKADEKVKGLK